MGYQSYDFGEMAVPGVPQEKCKIFSEVKQPLSRQNGTFRGIFSHLPYQKNLFKDLLVGTDAMSAN